jgi:hypothetical protein
VNSNSLAADASTRLLEPPGARLSYSLLPRPGSGRLVRS